MAIADKIVIENNEIIFRLNLETMSSVASKVIMDSLSENRSIQNDITEKSIQVENNASDTLQAKESVDQSLSTVLQAKDDVIALSTSTIANINNAGESALQEVATAKDNAIGEITPLVNDVTSKASQVTLDAEQVATDKDIVATNLGLTEAAKDEAQTAAGEITDKIDFTGLQQGDILRYNGTKLVRINQGIFLRSAEPVRFYFDSISSGVNVTTDSGRNLHDLGVSGYKFINVEGLDVGANSGRYIIKGSLLTTSSGNRYGIVFFADINNMDRFEMSPRGVYYTKVRGGVSEVIQSKITGGLNSNFFRIINQFELSAVIQASTSSELRSARLMSPFNMVGIEQSDLIDGASMTHIGLHESIQNALILRL